MPYAGNLNNLVPDGSFEDSAYRTLVDARSNSAWDFVSSGASDGSWYAQGNAGVNPSSFRDLALTSFVTAEMLRTYPGEVFDVNFAYKIPAAATGTGYLFIRWRDASGTDLGTSTFIAPTKDDTWRELSGTATAVANAAWFAIGMGLGNTGTSGLYRFDAVEVRRRTLTRSPITVDGSSLDNYAISITARARTFGGVVEGDRRMPGVDGEIASLNDDAVATLLTLTMLVRGADPLTGIIPADSLAQVESNLDALSFLFTKKTASLDIQQTHPGQGVRQMLGKVVDSIEPEILPGSSARLKVVLKIPGVYSQDVSTADWVTTPPITSGNFYEITSLRGSTAPIDDGIIRAFAGSSGVAISGLRLTDWGSGHFVQFNGSLPVGQAWRVNMATWASHYGATVTLGSADTVGTQADGITESGGVVGSRRMFRLVPKLDTDGIRKVMVALGGTTFNAGTQIDFRGRKKFLL